MGEIDVSIPSQAGILLAAGFHLAITGTGMVSIPSQAGILLAGSSRYDDLHRTRESQYPLRRASSWRFGHHCRHEKQLEKSQYPLRRASSWRAAYAERCARRMRRLNTLSGGHPLGGEARSSCELGYRSVSIPSQAGILLAARSSAPAASGVDQSQYPLRRASSWRALVDKGRAQQCERGLNTLSGGHPLGGRNGSAQVYHGMRVSIPSQAGILLAVYEWSRLTGWTCLNTLSGGHPLGGQLQAAACRPDVKVSIPSQAGILLAAVHGTGWRRNCG